MIRVLSWATIVFAVANLAWFALGEGTTWHLVIGPFGLVTYIATTYLNRRSRRRATRGRSR